MFPGSGHRAWHPAGTLEPSLLLRLLQPSLICMLTWTLGNSLEDLVVTFLSPAGTQPHTAPFLIFLEWLYECLVVDFLHCCIYVTVI